MKKYILVLFFLATIINAYAGSFVVNHLIIGSSKEKVESYFSELNLHAIGLYDSNHPDKYLICEEKSDMQDINWGIILAKKISKELSVSVLYTLIHDSDILYSVLITNSEVSFQFDSWPGYWDGDDQAPKIANSQELASFFKIDHEVLYKILCLESFDSEYVFAEEILEELRILLDIPEYIYFGYTYAKESKVELVDYGFQYIEW